MICSSNNTQKCGWALSTDVEQPIGQWADLFAKSNPLADAGQHLIIGWWFITYAWGGCFSSLHNKYAFFDDRFRNTSACFIVKRWYGQDA